MSQVILFWLTASLNPTLVACTTVMLLLDRPARLMLGYLCGALMTSITIGLIIVFCFPTSSSTTTTQHTISPAADIGLGALALALASCFTLGDRHAPASAPRGSQSGQARQAPAAVAARAQQGLSTDHVLVGALLTLPGASYLAGLHAIHELHYSTAQRSRS